MTQDPQPQDWKPQRGETYWYFEADDIIASRTWIPTCWDLKQREFGNVFQSLDEAILVMEELRDSYP